MRVTRARSNGGRNIIGTVRAAFPQIVSVRCTVSKLAPPLGGKLDRVSVVLER